MLLLSNCSSQIQRSRLHQLGFALGISQWIENFHEQVSGEGVGFSHVQEQKRPIAVVKPVPSSTEQTNQLLLPVAEVSKKIKKVSKDPHLMIPLTFTAFTTCTICIASVLQATNLKTSTKRYH